MDDMFDLKIQNGDLLSSNKFWTNLSNPVIGSCAWFSINLRSISGTVPLSSSIPEQGIVITSWTVHGAESVNLKGMGAEQTAIIYLSRNSSVRLHLLPK